MPGSAPRPDAGIGGAAPIAAWAAGGLCLARQFSSPHAVAVQGIVQAAMLALVPMWLAAAAMADYRTA